MLFWLFISALSVFVTGQLLRIQLHSGMVIQVTDAVVFLAVFSWSVREFYNKKLFNHFDHPYTKPILFFVFVGLISLLVNSTWLTLQQLFVSSLYLLRWIVYALVFYMVKSFPKRKKQWIEKILIIVLSIIIFFGYLQYIFYPNLRNLYYLGWDEHLYRLFSTLLDPNFAAAIFSLFLLLLFGNLFKENIHFNKQFFGMVVIFVFSFIALLLTYSRGGFLTFSVGSIIFFLLLKKRLYLFVLLGTFILGIILIPKDLRSSGVELWRTASVFARTDAAQQAITIFSHYPLLGVGFDTYRYAQKNYGFAADVNWEVSHSGGGTDSSLLFVLATTGIIGFSAYVYLWWRIISRIYKIYKTNKTYRIFALVILSSLGALFVNSFFINSLFYPFVLFWIWTLLGVIENNER